MNKQRRKDITEAQKLVNEARMLLESAKELFEPCASDERDAYDNMPESLQSSERGEACCQAADDLDEAMEKLQNMLDDADGFDSLCESATRG